jgi:nucleoid-associated protein YgaU
MAVRHRVACSLTALTLGSMAALPFYRRADTVRHAPPATAGAPRAEGSAAPAVLALRIAPRGSDSDSAPLTGLSAATSTGPHDSPGPAGRAAELEPPPIAPEFPDADDAVPPAAGRTDGAGRQPLSAPGTARDDSARPAGSTANDALAPAAESQGHAGRPPRQARSVVPMPRGTSDSADRRHRIRDGDTLQGIARRYFGREELWVEILSANRSVLRDPDVLPVGQQIVIPPRTSLPATDSAPHGEDPAASIPREQPLTTLVPIP